MVRAQGAVSARSFSKRLRHRGNAHNISTDLGLEMSVWGQGQLSTVDAARVNYRGIITRPVDMRPRLVRRTS